MEELVVTKFWMAGVMGIMVLYGICALIGYSRSKNQA